MKFEHFENCVNILFVIFLSLILFEFCGCNDYTLEEKMEHQQIHDKNLVLSLLPPNSSIVKTLDSQWYVVKIKIDENTTKQYLFKWWYGSHGEVSILLTEDVLE